MDAITRIAVRHNPAVKVFLVIPSMKDISSFNEAFLKRQGRSDLVPSLEKHPQLKRAFLNLKAREMFGQTVDLQSTNLIWFKKRIFSMKTVFDRYYNDKNQPNPHHKFWMGGSDRLDALDLCYDGLHYTEAVFEKMFAILSQTNFQKRTQDPIPATTPIPTTTTTTSVIVEEVESVPGPSGIQGRLEYRPSQPAAVPSTLPKRTKGKSKTYYSRTFVHSMGLGEQQSTASESPQPRDGVKTTKKKRSSMDCPSSTSTSKKSRPTQTLPTPIPTTSTASTSKSKGKGLWRFNIRRKKQRKNIVREGSSLKSTVNTPQPSSSSTVSSELTTFATLQIAKFWKFAKERGVSKETALKELNRVFEQVTAMDHQD